MVSCLCKEQSAFFNLVNQSVFLGDSPRPNTTTQVAKRFRFSQTNKRVSAYGFDQLKNFQMDLTIRGHPKSQVIQKIPVEDQQPFHKTHYRLERLSKELIERISPSPLSKRLSAARSLRALAGERSRWAVS